MHGQQHIKKKFITLVSFLGTFVFERVAVVQVACCLLVSILAAVSILPALPELLEKRLQTSTVNELASAKGSASERTFKSDFHFGRLQSHRQISTSEGYSLTDRFPLRKVRVSPTTKYRRTVRRNYLTCCC